MDTGTNSGTDSGMNGGISIGMGAAMGARRGILAVWHDIEPGHLADVLAWYDAEHHFERLGVPGFLSVRRYHAIVAAPQLFIRYETTGADVLASAPYLERLNHPTPWTIRAQPFFRNNSRTVCTRAARAGRAEGGFVVTARHTAEDGGAAPATWWPRLLAELLGAGATAGDVSAAPPRRPGVGIPGVVGVELWQADADASAIPTAEKRLRGGADQHMSAAVVVHATDKAAADEAVRLLAGLPPAGAAWGLGTYALAFAASNPPL